MCANPHADASSLVPIHSSRLSPALPQVFPPELFGPLDNAVAHAATCEPHRRGFLFEDHPEVHALLGSVQYVASFEMVFQLELNGIHVQLLSHHVSGYFDGVAHREVTNAPHASGGQEIGGYAHHLRTAVLSTIHVDNTLERVILVAVGAIVEEVQDVEGLKHAAL